MARLSRLEQYERTALAVMAHVMAGESVSPEIRQAAETTLASIRQRTRLRQVAKRRYAKRKAARAAAEAARNDPEAQFAAESERRIREALR